MAKKKSTPQEETLETENQHADAAEAAASQAPAAAGEAAAEAQEAEPTEETAAQPEAESQTASLEAELENARSQMQEYLEGWQRERAAFANYRRRMEEQQAQIRRDITASIAKRYLEVLDDLELALKNKPAEGDGAAWAEGIELIYRKMLTILEAEGIKPIPAEPGTPFDPRFHEAITHEPHDEHGSEEIIEVVRRGYMIGDQVLRPALVRVAQ